MALRVDKRSITKLEMLLAVAMSGYYQTTHVNYIPPGTTYRRMLMVLITSKDIEPLGEHFYTLTKKGRNYITQQNITECKEVDTEIDAFINQL